MDEKTVSQRFRSRRVLTIEQLVDLLQCSVITVRRRLKQWMAYRSFNKNGRYYTLPEIPKFDKNGLWKYQTIFFSKHGNLKNTIIQLVKQSKTGLSAYEITQLVGLPANSSFLSQFRNVPGIRREKHRGRFIYFSDDPKIYTGQKQKWILHRQEIIKLPSDADAVVILVQYIKHPDISIEELSNSIARQGKHIDSFVIKSFLQYHDLLKKIPDIQQ